LSRGEAKRNRLGIISAVKEGIFARVLQGGVVKAGDQIRIEKNG
jgi:MOSC domain-containing protein YiiM